MTTLRVAVLAPFAPPSVRGNSITVDRISTGLRARGVDLRVWDLSVTAQATVEDEVAAYGPTLVHAFHAYRVGPLALRLARRAEVPLLVTITGTDANHDLFDPERAAVVRRVLEGASRIVVFHASMSARISGALPDLASRLCVIPQTSRLPHGADFDLAARWPLPHNRVLFLFPAGIRMVKNPLRPLAAFDRLVTRRPESRLLYVGPILDPGEGEALLRALAARPWAHHLGPVPHAAMRSVVEAADAVLNTSISEGGMANSVLEAMAMGRPVIASDIEGNRSLVEDGVTGLLFRDDAMLEAAAERLAADPELRRRLGEAARAKVDRLFPPEREIDSYLETYRTLTPVER